MFLYVRLCSYEVHSANDVRALKTRLSGLNLFFYQEIIKRPKFTTNYKNEKYVVVKKCI